MFFIIIPVYVFLLIDYILYVFLLIYVQVFSIQLIDN